MLAALGRLFRRRSAVSRDDPPFGRTAVITLGAASRAHGAQAEILDPGDGPRFVTVMPRENRMRFNKGDRIEIVGREGGVYVGVPADHR